MVCNKSLYKTDYISCLDGYNNSKFTIYILISNYHYIINTWELIPLLLILVFRFITEITILLRFHFV